MVTSLTVRPGGKKRAIPMRFKKEKSIIGTGGFKVNTPSTVKTESLVGQRSVSTHRRTAHEAQLREWSETPPSATHTR